MKQKKTENITACHSKEKELQFGYKNKEEPMMDRRWKRRAAALLAALALTIPARAAQIEADGQTLNAKDAWVEEGTSYVTLRAFSARTGRSLTWTGEKARLAGTGLELEAAPGALYVTANDRVLYVPGGVRVEDGVTILPLSVLANAAGAELTWDGENAAARLKVDGAILALPRHLRREPGGAAAGADRRGQRGAEPGGQRPVP